MQLLFHYLKLIDFTFNRFKKGRYSEMREYFASILVREVEEQMPLQGKKVLDVGGAGGEFCRFLSERKSCLAVNLDPFPPEESWRDTVVGSAEKMPFLSDVFDLVICRGVIEHIPPENREKVLSEIRRVLVPGGICYLMIPPWYNPHAGHQLKPFHLLPYGLAKTLRQLFFRNRIEEGSLSELGLFPITFRQALKLAKAAGLKVLSTKDTHFRLHFLTKIPLIREVMVPAVVFLLLSPGKEL